MALFGQGNWNYRSFAHRSPAHRGNGIASRIANRTAEIARSLGVKTLHVQTERLDGGLYARLGWAPFEQVNYRGLDVLVMERHLGA